MSGRGELLRPGLHRECQRKAQEPRDYDGENDPCRPQHVNFLRQRDCEDHQDRGGGGLHHGNLSPAMYLRGMAQVDDVEGEDQRSAEGKKIAVIHALKIQSAGGDSQQVQADECHHYAQRAPAADRAFPEQGEE